MSRLLQMALAASLLAVLVPGELLGQKPPYRGPVIVTGPNIRAPRTPGVPTRPLPRAVNDNRRREVGTTTSGGARPAGTPRRVPANANATKASTTSKAVVPAAGSPQVLQARATARQNYLRWRKVLRMRLLARQKRQREEAAALAARERAEDALELRRLQAVSAALAAGFPELSAANDDRKPNDSFDTRESRRAELEAASSRTIRVTRLEGAAFSYVPLQYRSAVAASFRRGEEELVQCDEDIIVYRYPFRGNMPGRYFSAKPYVNDENARRYLALPAANPGSNLEVWRIKKGALAIRGPAADQTANSAFGPTAEGGGIQWYLLDMSFAERLK